MMSLEKLHCDVTGVCCAAIFVYCAASGGCGRLSSLTPRLTPVEPHAPSNPCRASRPASQPGSAPCLSHAPAGWAEHPPPGLLECAPGNCAALPSVSRASPSSALHQHSWPSSQEDSPFSSCVMWSLMERWYARSGIQVLSWLAICPVRLPSLPC